MKFLDLLGSSADAPRRVSRLFHSAGVTSIRFAMVLGCALLCMISMRANAAPLLDDLGPAAARPVHDALGQLSGSACTARSLAETGAGAPSAYADGEGCAAGGQPGKNIRAATADEWQTWFLAIVAPAIVALGNACLFRGVLASTAETPRRTEDEWAHGLDSTETVECASHPAASAEAGAALPREPFANPWPGGADADMVLCRTIAQRMQGELLMSSGADCDIQASFSAPFAAEQWASISELARNTQSPSTIVAQLQEAPPAFPSEPFERRYLEALSEEGIDLRTFLAGWRDSIDDDLARLSDVSQHHHSDGLYSVLHRLSGAVGLVGAHSLMEALQRASVAPMEHDADAIDTLAERTRTLAMQLDAAIDPHGSVIR